MLMSQEAATKLFRTKSGATLLTSVATVKSLPKTQDGKRQKVLKQDVEKAVSDFLTPEVEPQTSVISARMADRINRVGL